MKRFLSLLLALVMVFSLVPVRAVHAHDDQPLISETHLNPLYEGLLAPEVLAPPEIPPLPAGSGQYCADLNAAAVFVRSQMLARTPVYTVLMPRDMYYPELMNDIFYKACEHTGNPKEGDSLYRQWGGSQYSAAWDGSNVSMTYSMSYYTTAAQEAAMDVAVDQLLQELDCDPSDPYGSTKKVYDWLCDNVTYDYANLEDDTHKLKYTGYAALMDRTAVCQGYALLFYRLMLELGIDNRLIVGYGNGGLHAWNIVNLYGKYYNLDSTWDAGAPYYNYFLRAEHTFGDHLRNEEFDTAEFHNTYPMSPVDYDPSQNPCASGHTWTSSSCTDASRCIYCGTVGPAAGHQWNDATCDTLKSCTECGYSDGSYGHVYDNDTDSSCNTCGQFRLVCCKDEIRGIVISTRSDYGFTLYGADNAYVSFLRKEETSDGSGVLYKYVYELSLPEAGIFTLCFVQDDTGKETVFTAKVNEHNFEDGFCTSCGTQDMGDHYHIWTEATCYEPMTCTICGITDGEPLSHDWTEATCTAPMTCTLCGLTDGEPLEHIWDSHSCAFDRTCTVCGTTLYGGYHVYDDDEDDFCNTCDQFRLLGCVNTMLGVTITTWTDENYAVTGTDTAILQYQLTDSWTEDWDGDTAYKQNYDLQFSAPGIYEFAFVQYGTEDTIPFTAEIRNHNYENGVCTLCGTPDSVHIHEWQDATCTEPRTCITCGEIDGEPLDHDWAEATCYDPMTCRRCGATDGYPLDHDWADATCHDPMTCSRCGLTEGEPLDHEWDNDSCGVDRTCTLCGEFLYAGSHVYDGDYDENCNVCGQFRLLGCVNEVLSVVITTWSTEPFTLTGKDASMAQHWLTEEDYSTLPYKLYYSFQFSSTGTFELCFEQRNDDSPLYFNAEIRDHNFVDGTCSECGASDSVHNHEWQDATCTEPRTCITCGETDGSPLGHEWMEATCEDPLTCNRCGITDGNPLGHEWMEATCTTPRTCLRCGITDGEPLDHSWADATCTTPRTCQHCGITDGEPLDHSWADATCTTPRTCRLCGMTEGNALGHEWDVIDCNANRTCIYCGTTLAAGSHVYDNDDDSDCNSCGRFRLLGCVNEELGVTITTGLNEPFTLAGEDLSMVQYWQTDSWTEGIFTYKMNYSLQFSRTGIFELRFEQPSDDDHIYFTAEIRNHVYEDGVCVSCGLEEGYHVHDWTAATCTDPKTCKICGISEGDPLGHSWTDATCTEASVCQVCGVQDGEALGHDWDDYACTSEKHCLNCSATEEAGKHTYDDEDDEDCNTCGQFRLLGCPGEKMYVTATTWVDDTFILTGEGVEYVQVRFLSQETEVVDGATAYHQDYELIFSEKGVFELVFVQRGTDERLPFTADISGHRYQDGVCTKCFAVQTTTVMPGDTDMNGSVDYLDAMAALQAAVGLLALSDDAKAAADVDRDGEVSYLDAMEILRFSVGLVDTFYALPPHIPTPERPLCATYRR